LLKALTNLPPARPLTILQKTQVSKFRYYLAGQANTVIPFLKSVDWSNEEVHPTRTAYRRVRKFLWLHANQQHSGARQEVSSCNQ
jgi:hypothetical protein